MAQYMNFYYHKTDSNNYFSLGSFSANTKIYEALQYKAPYGDCFKLNENIITSILTDLKQDKQDLLKEVTMLKDRMQLVAAFNNSVEDKIEEIELIEERILEIKYDFIESIDWAIGYFNTLLYIIQDNFDEKFEILAGIEYCP